MRCSLVRSYLLLSLVAASCAIPRLAAAQTEAAVYPPQAPATAVYPPPPAAPSSHIQRLPAQPQLSIDAARIHLELDSLDARMREIRPHTRLTGPYMMTIFGFAATGAAAVVGLLSTALSGLGCDEGCGPALVRRIWVRTGAVMAVTLSVGITGAWWLHRKRQERQPYLPELFALKARRRQLVEALRQ